MANPHIDFDSLPVFTLAQVAQHGSEKDCWLAVRGLVYDLTSFLRIHPGGSKTIMSVAGKEATLEFEAIHFMATTVLERNTRFVIGRLEGAKEKKPSEDPIIFGDLLPKVQHHDNHSSNRSPAAASSNNNNNNSSYNNAARDGQLANAIGRMHMKDEEKIEEGEEEEEEQGLDGGSISASSAF